VTRRAALMTLVMKAREACVMIAARLWRVA
jgi:hypothetical protein